MQLGVVNEEAAERARAKGVTVVMNRCPEIEFRRLFDRPRAVGSRPADVRLGGGWLALLRCMRIFDRHTNEVNDGPVFIRFLFLRNGVTSRR